MRDRGVPVFAEPEMAADLVVIYLPAAPACVFQPYRSRLCGGAVRG